MDKAEKIREKLSAEIEKAEKLAAGEISSSTDLVHVDRSAPVMKREMLRRKQDLERTKQNVEALQEQLHEELERQMHNKMVAIREVVGPLEKQIEEIEEGMWMINLYMGQKEEIVRVRKGKPAKKDEPIVIRQMVLGMDEESAVNAEEGGISYYEVEAFDKWVKQSWAHVEQVMPEPKGVVAICPRMADTKLQEGMSFEQAMAAMREDKHTYFLIRNGRNVFRLWTNFSVGERMVPTPSEFQEIFKRRDSFKSRDWDGNEKEWTDEDIQEAEERLAAHERHYLRVGLILQGLADRTPVFHPLPDAGLSFTSNESYDAGRVKFIMDAEPSLGTGREPFYNWLKRLNSELRPGMRIIGQFSGYGGAFEQENECSQEYGDYGHSRLSPKRASKPESLEIHTIESRKQDGSLVFKYRRTDTQEGWVPAEPGWKRRSFDIPYKNRASCTIYPDDQFIIPIDFVTVEEMEDYLHARTERHAYIQMFPLLHKAIEIKKREAEEEKPFRILLAAEVSKANDITVAEADEMLDGLIWWWKLKNKEHHALVGDDEARALKQIVEESVKRRKRDAKHTPPELLEKLMESYPEALVIARRHDDKHVAVLPMTPEENNFVRIEVLDKKGEVIETRDWAEPPAGISHWRVFYESPLWREEWNRAATFGEFPTGPEKDLFVKKHKTKKVVAITYDTRNRKFETWKIEHRKIPKAPKIGLGGRREFEGGRYWEHTVYRWSRDKHREIRFEEDRWNSHRTSGKEPWTPEGRSQYGERRVVLYEDRSVFEKAQEQDAAIKEIEDASQPLERAFEHGCHQFNDMLAEVYEKRAFDEFMAEYGDESLWPGYRKSNYDDAEFYPHHSQPESDLAFVATLIEEGKNVNGKKLKALAKMAGVELPEDYDPDWIFDTDGREDETNEEFEKKEERRRKKEERRARKEEEQEEREAEEEEEEEAIDPDEVEIDGEVVEGDFAEDDIPELEAGS